MIAMIVVIQEIIIVEINNFNNNQIKRLTLITSEYCNLKCRYCEIAKTSTYSHQQLNNILKDAMKNGLYFSNIQKIFQQYNLDVDLIKKIELWGEEPSFTIDTFYYLCKELISFFPNFDQLFFSTNGISNIDKILFFIKEIDQILNKDFNLEIQFSYDGEWGTLNNRGIEASVIKNNLINFIQELNKIKLNYIHINLFFHCVTDFTLINYLVKEDKIESYWQELHDITQYFQNLSTNLNVNVFNVTEGFYAPYNATKEEGELYSYFENISDLIILKNKLNIAPHYRRKLFPLFINKNKTQKKYEETIQDEIINKIFNFENNNDKNLDYIGCGTGITTLKIRYDGTMIHCHNILYGLSYEENNQNKDILRKNIRNNSLQHNFYPNLLLEKDKENLNEWFNRWKINKGYSVLINVYSQILNTMYLLLENGQISNSYRFDEQKLLRHAYLICFYFFCTEESLNFTGSIYGEYLGKIRMLANGFLDLVDYYQKQHYLKEQNDE